MSECPIWIVTSLERWITVLCCAKSKRISIIYVVGSSQLTLQNHEWGPQDSFKVGTKMNLQACIGTPAPSNPMSIHPRTKPNYRKKRIHREDRIWTRIPGWRTWRRHYSRFSSSSMSTSTPWQTSHWRSGSNVLGCYTSSIDNAKSGQIPKMNWKQIPRVTIGRTAFTAGASHLQVERFSFPIPARDLSRLYQFGKKV